VDAQTTRLHTSKATISQKDLVLPPRVLSVFCVRVDTLTSSTQKLKLMREGSQSTYTLQHPHSRAARERHKRRQRERHNPGNKWVEAQIKPLRGEAARQRPPRASVMVSRSSGGRGRSFGALTISPSPLMIKSRLLKWMVVPGVQTTPRPTIWSLEKKASRSRTNPYLARQVCFEPAPTSKFVCARSGVRLVSPMGTGFILVRTERPYIQSLVARATDTFIAQCS
jgi:hypothetical protein